MTIEEAIILIEHNHLEKDIKALTDIQRLNFWASLKEFERPKIQRSVFEPVKNSDIKIVIEYASDQAKTHKSISQPLDQSEEDQRV